MKSSFNEDQNYTKNIDNLPSSDTSLNGLESSRIGVISTIDDFIMQILKIRKILLCVSISAIMLAPLAIALSFFLFFHPTFFAVLEIENEFGVVLGALLTLIIIISVVWIIAGIKQYCHVGRKWAERYEQYQRHKEEVDRKIAQEYGIEK